MRPVPRPPGGQQPLLARPARAGAAAPWPPPRQVRKTRLHPAAQRTQAHNRSHALWTRRRAHRLFRQPWCRTERRRHLQRLCTHQRHQCSMNPDHKRRQGLLALAPCALQPSCRPVAALSARQPPSRNGAAQVQATGGRAHPGRPCGGAHVHGGHETGVLRARCVPRFAPLEPDRAEDGSQTHPASQGVATATEALAPRRAAPPRSSPLLGLGAQ